MNRRPRGAREPGRPIEVTERDLDALLLIGLLRSVSTEQLARELFPNPDRCRRRLRQLLDAGLLKITLIGSTRPNLVSLTRAGITLLGSRRPDAAAGLQLPGPMALAGVAHHLALVDARLYLTALAQSETGTLVSFASGAGALARERGFDRIGLVPDALAELALGEDRVRLAIEVDCATEGSRVLEAKLGRYREAFGRGCVDELWLVCTGGSVRGEHLAQFAIATGVGANTRVMPLAHIIARPVRRPRSRAAAEGWAEGPNPPVNLSHIPLQIQSLERQRPDVERRADRGTVG